MKNLYVFFFVSVVLTVVAASKPSDQASKPAHPLNKLPNPIQPASFKNLVRTHRNRYKPYVIYPGRRYKAVIHFAAKDFGKLFVNGVKMAIAKRRRTRRLVVFVKRGDVISVVAFSRRRHGGVLVDLKINRRHYVTGRHGWKAALGGSRRARAWMIRRRGFCWSDPTASLGRRGRWAQRFPYRYGARSIWPRHTRYSKTKRFRYAFLRFVVGGNGCARRIPPFIPRPLPPVVIKPQKKHCRCRLAKIGRGTCYELRNPKAKYGSCTRRTCEPSYECVNNRAKKLPLCVRRYTKEKVVPVKSHICRKIYSKQAFYVPYQF